MSRTLELLHPFMPFITEEIWQSMPHAGETIMTAAWPSSNGQEKFQTEQEAMRRVMDAIRAVRNRRSEMNVPPSKKARVFIAAAQPADFQACISLVERLAYASGVEIGDNFDLPGAVTIVTNGAKIYIPMDELVDREAEQKRLQKELDTAEKQLAQCENKLNNQGFLAKAPANVIEGARQNAQRLKEQIAMIRETLESLQG